MRLWSVHPGYLDFRGLVALWREALLARSVLSGKTQGYRHHPQLERFRLHAFPLQAIDAYLAAVHDEAAARRYAFDKNKIGRVATLERIPLTTGQLVYEWQHLLAKLAVRAPSLHERFRHIPMPECHPLFRLSRGPVASWERM